MRKLFLVIFMLLSAFANGQGIGGTTILNQTNSGDDQEYQVWSNSGTGGSDESIPLGSGIFSPIDFAVLTGLSGISSAATSNAVSSSHFATLVLKAECDTADDTINYLVLISDGTDYAFSSSGTLTCSETHNATDFASAGTGLTCTTACEGAPAVYIPILGASSVKVRVTAIGTGPVTIWGDVITGVAP